MLSFQYPKLIHNTLFYMEKFPRLAEQGGNLVLADDHYGRALRNANRVRLRCPIIRESPATVRHQPHDHRTSINVLIDRRPVLGSAGGTRALSMQPECRELRR